MFPTPTPGFHSRLLLGGCKVVSGDCRMSTKLFRYRGESESGIPTSICTPKPTGSSAGLGVFRRVVQSCCLVSAASDPVFHKTPVSPRVFPQALLTKLCTFAHFGRLNAHSNVHSTAGPAPPPPGCLFLSSQGASVKWAGGILDLGRFELPTSRLSGFSERGQIPARNRINPW